MPLLHRHNRIFIIGLVLLTLATSIGAILTTQLGRRSTPISSHEYLQPVATNRSLTKTDQLIWDYQERLRQAPEDVNTYALLGNAYIQKMRETGDPTFYTRAEEAFDTALQRDAQHSDALIGKGTLALARHQFQEALDLGERVRALNPDVARVYGVIGDAQIELGMYDEAVETIQTMVDLRPDLSSYSRVAYVRELYGDIPGAIEAMQLALSAGGPTAENTQWTRVQLGHLYFGSGDIVNAEAQYRQALNGIPNYVYALEGMGKVRAAQGRTVEAIAFYRKAIDHMPLPEFVITFGELLEATGHTEEAKQQYALVKTMQQLFAANGADTNLELALFDVNHGSDLQAAVAQARTAYDRRPTIKAADTLAWGLYKNGQYAEAHKYISEALCLGTQDAQLFYHAGAIAYKLNDISAADTYLKQALAINPHFSPLSGPHLQHMLVEIEGKVYK